MVVLDTCALIWWTLSPDKLSPAASQACNRIGTSGGFVSSITIWEIGLKVKKGILRLGLPFEAYVDRLQRADTLVIVPIDEKIWMKNLALPWSHGDPADRTIVATALLHGLPIVTCDALIRDFYPNVVW